MLSLDISSKDKVGHTPILKYTTLLLSRITWYVPTTQRVYEGISVANTIVEFRLVYLWLYIEITTEHLIIKYKNNLSGDTNVSLGYELHLYQRGSTNIFMG